MTDGCTLNPSVQAESTLFGYFAANTKKANFSLFKYTLRYIDVQEGGTPAGRGDSNKSRPLRFLPPLRYSSSSKYGVRKQIWIQIWFIQYEHFPLNTAIFSILVKPWIRVFSVYIPISYDLPPVPAWLWAVKNSKKGIKFLIFRRILKWLKISLIRWLVKFGE